LQNPFVRLGDMVINLEHVTRIAKVKSENVYYFEVYIDGGVDPFLQFREDSTEGKALRYWFERVAPLAHTGNDVPLAD
jgi:hypothetical protein